MNSERKTLRIALAAAALALPTIACLDSADSNGGIDSQNAGRFFDSVERFLDSGAGFIPVAGDNSKSLATPVSR